MSLEEQNPENQLGKESINFEDFWGEIEDSIRQEIDDIYTEKTKGFKHNDEDEKQEKINSLMTNEKVFLEKVITALYQAKESNPKEIILLFDIDDTIAKAQFTSGEYSGDIIRPSFKYLMDKIIPEIKKIKIGFITTRGRCNKDNLIKQLGDNNHLLPIEKYIDKNYLFPTAEDSEHDSDPERDDVVKFKKIYGEFVELNNDSDVFSLRSTGALRKLDIIKKLIGSEQHNQSAIIVVDDDSGEYPNYLKKEKRLFGVSLTGIDGGYFYV